MVAMPSAAASHPAPVFARMLWNERPVLGDLADLAWRRRSLPRGPRGEGRPVIVLPGYLATDGPTGILRRYLRGLGYDARGWGLGQNTGDVPRFAEALGEQLAASPQPVALIGWSLGGVIARQVARERPEAVAQVVTLGSPIGASQPTAFAPLSTPEQRAQYAARVEAREAAPVPASVPLTSIYSKADRIVPWQDSIDRTNPHAEHAEVQCSHSGLVVSRQVFAELAERLGRGRAEPND